MNTKNSKSAGFTFIELVTAIGVIIILTTIFIVYSRTSNQQIIFFKEESLLVSSLLRVKSFSIQTFQPTQQPGQLVPPPVSNPTEQICAWGIHVDRVAGQYVIFKDLAQPLPPSVPLPTDRCAGSYGPNGMYDAGTAEAFETVIIDPTTAFHCIELVASGTAASCSPSSSAGAGISSFDVLFIPPDPKVKFYPDVTAAEAVLVLKLKTGSRFTTIHVNSVGQVTVQ